MTVSLIAAAAENDAIGRSNGMIWHLPEDLAYFRETTMGRHVVFGRKSFESLGRTLPGRILIVLTRRPACRPGRPHAGDPRPGRPADPERRSHDPERRTKDLEPMIVHSEVEALLLARKNREAELFVAGGGQTYRLFWPHASRIYLTRVHARPHGDVFFPEMGPEWREISRREGQTTDPCRLTFHIYERMSEGGTHNGADR